jgi:hypothetical protein
MQEIRMCAWSYGEIEFVEISNEFFSRCFTRHTSVPHKSVVIRGHGTLLSFFNVSSREGWTAAMVCGGPAFSWIFCEEPEGGVMPVEFLHEATENFG